MNVVENHKSRWYPHLRYPAAQGRLALTFKQRQQKLFLKPELRHREKEKERGTRERERERRKTSRLKPQEIYAMWKTAILNLVNPLIRFRFCNSLWTILYRNQRCWEMRILQICLWLRHPKDNTRNKRTIFIDFLLHGSVNREKDPFRKV